MVKTVFSVIKKRSGENVGSKRYYSQLKEIKIRMILQNMTIKKIDRISTGPNLN